MVWKSDDDTTLLVTIVISAKSNQMKSTMTFYLMFLKALFILVTWALLSFIKFVLLLLFIGTTTCFLGGLFVVMLIYSLNLLSSLMIFWIFSILFALREGKTSLILRTSSVLLPNFETWVNNFPILVFAWSRFWSLKYLKISLTSLEDLVEIGGGNLSMLTGLIVFFSSFWTFLMELTLEVHLKDIFCLNELLLLSAKRESYSVL